jgi:tRNA G18 (ribose-2'-O)-methylase SpoU
MPIVDIHHPGDPRLALYRNIPDPELVRSAGLFVAEGRLVVRRLLGDTRLVARSLLVTRPALASLADVSIADSALPVYVVSQDVINTVTGFDIHRGCLALGERPAPRDWREISGGPDRPAQGDAGPPTRETKTEGPPLLVILENVGNADNVGSIFRSSAALGATGVLLAPGCADPLYRKSIRTSMGASLSLPFAAAAPWPAMLDELRLMGVAVIALTPDGGAMPLRQAVAAAAGRPVALVAGHEGDGLSPGAIDRAEIRARIDISPAVDSLNVATAAAIAMYELRS